MLALALAWASLATMFSVPTLAADRQHIKLNCAGTIATITCTRFDDGHCVDSRLLFITKAGRHVVPPAPHIKQDFVEPTIADGLSCDKTKSKTAFVVWYTPGCHSAACYFSELYGINGQIITHNGKGASRFYGTEAQDQKLTKSISLRDSGAIK